MKCKIIIAIILLSTMIYTDTPHNDYQPVTIKFIEKYFPLKRSKEKKFAYEIDARIPNLSIVARFGGKIRKIKQKGIRRFHSLLGKKNKFLSDMKDLTWEINLQYKEKDYWVLLPERFDKDRLTALRKNTVYAFNVTFIGYFYKGGPRRILLLRSINSRLPVIENHTPFTTSLAGIKLNGPMLENLMKLEKKYGKPYKIIEHKNYEIVVIFILDKKTKTVLYVFNGGPSYVKNIHSLQLSSYKKGTMKFYKNLSLGSTLEDIKKVFSSSQLEMSFNGNIQVIKIKNSYCSFELKKGKIYSVHIAVDPYK